MVLYVDSKGVVDFRKPYRLRVGPVASIGPDGNILVWVFSGKFYTYQQEQLACGLSLSSNW